MFGFIFVASMLLLMLLITIIDGFHFNLGGLAIAGGTCLVSSTVYSWILSVVFPAAFSADGIYGHSFWGRRRFVRWQDVASVKPIRLGNLRWLRIYAADGKITWLAMFQARKLEFRQEFSRLAPATCPVLDYFR